MFYAKIISYDVLGNEKDGYEVNNLYDEGTVKINGDPRKLTDKQILKRINGKQGDKQWNGRRPMIKIDMRSLAIDNNNMSLGLILLTDRRGVKPVGEIRLFDSKMEPIY